jgi:hypothetical protein
VPVAGKEPAVGGTLFFTFIVQNTAVFTLLHDTLGLMLWSVVVQEKEVPFVTAK